MTIDEIRDKGLIILECISGSRAYGLETPGSDTDIKGVFLLPKKCYYGLDYMPQVNNETNDIVFYEFGRFMELLKMADSKKHEMEKAFEKSSLPEKPDPDLINDLTFRLRDKFYQEQEEV